MTALLTLLLAASLALAPHDRGPADEVQAVLAGIATAVDADTGEPLTGTREGDALLLLVWSHHESRWRVCPGGDGGKAWGPLQLQHTPRALVCAPAEAARIWLAMARAAVATCGDLTPIASGVCGRARGLVVRRMREAEGLQRRSER